MAMLRKAMSRTTVWGHDVYARQRGDNAGNYLRALLRCGPPPPEVLLHRALLDASVSVPYWRLRLRGDRDLLAQHRDLVPLTKDDIREAGSQILCQDIEQRPHWRTHSGGSTGAPIEITFDQDYLDWSDATQRWYFKKFLGVPLRGVPRIIVWGSERDLQGLEESWTVRAQNFATQTKYLNSFRMGDADMADYLNVINRFKPVYIRGYAGSPYQLAQFALREQIQIHRPELVYSAAETLRDDMRETVKSAFNAPIFDFYGSREVGPMTGEIPGGSMLAFSFFNYLEVLREDGLPAGPGETGRVVVTSLHNRAMPLIRYDIGDTAEVEEVCPGGHVKSLKRIVGRVSDHFVSARGNQIHGEYFTHLFYGTRSIREFQVVQVAVDEVEIKWVPSASDEVPERAAINEQIRMALGNCSVTWTQVQEIPLTPQGKRLYTRSLVQTHQHRGGPK